MATKPETQVPEGDNWFCTDALACLCAHTQSKCNKNFQSSVLSGHKVLPRHFRELALIFLVVSAFLCTRGRIQCVFFSFPSLHSLNLFHPTDFHPVPRWRCIMIFTNSMAVKETFILKVLSGWPAFWYSFGYFEKLYVKFLHVAFLDVALCNRKPFWSTQLLLSRLSMLDNHYLCLVLNHFLLLPKWALYLLQGRSPFFSTLSSWQPLSHILSLALSTLGV